MFPQKNEKPFSIILELFCRGHFVFVSCRTGVHYDDVYANLHLVAWLKPMLIVKRVLARVVLNPNSSYVGKL